MTGFNTGKINVGSDTFKLALGTGTVPTANRDCANEYFAGSDFTEASGTGYTTGGNTVTLAGAQYTTGGVHNYAVAASALTSSWAPATLTSRDLRLPVRRHTSHEVCDLRVGFRWGAERHGQHFSVNFTDTTPNYRVWYWSVT